jgi:hypothetical protein
VALNNARKVEKPGFDRVGIRATNFLRKLRLHLNSQSKLWGAQYYMWRSIKKGKSGEYGIHSPAKVVECCGENLKTSTVFVHSIKYAGNTKRFLSITDCRLELLEFSAWDKSLLQVQDH